MNCVVLTLQPQKPPFASLGYTTTLHHVVITNYLCPNEAPFHIGMDFAGGFKGSGTILNRPDLNFSRDGSEE